METHGEEGVVEQLVRNCEHGTLWQVGKVSGVEELSRNVAWWNSMARRKRQVVGVTTCKRPIAPILALILCVNNAQNEKKRKKDQSNKKKSIK
jgi:hypothetical protein